jgi:hypothetical protein
MEWRKLYSNRKIESMADREITKQKWKSGNQEQDSQFKCVIVMGNEQGKELKSLAR